MTDLPEASGAPATVKIAGETMRVGRLTYGLLGEFTQWVKGRLIDAARQSAPPGPDRDYTVQQALKQAAQITTLSPEAIASLNEPEGMVRLAWLALRVEQPDFTLEEAERRLQNAVEMNQVVDKVLEVNADLFGLKGKEGEEESTSEDDEGPGKKGSSISA